MTSNEERFVKADFEACELEKQLGRKLTSEEYSEFTLWHIQNSQKQPWLRTPNPVKSGTME